ncbi:hypothetical protein P4U07_13400 [Bacillus mycoides]|nr:hypothetical protein [Bacillus mycoides]
MNGVLSASKLIKASQVRQQCAEMRNEPLGSYSKGGKLSEEW